MRKKSLYRSIVGSTPCPFEVIVHPSPAARAIIINVPGYNGHIDGFNNKYRTLGAYLSRTCIGAFIQMPNTVWPGREYKLSLVEDLLAVCAYARKEAGNICAAARPNLYLMGFSAGGSAVAGGAQKCGAQRILLMEPSLNHELVGNAPSAIEEFTGEVRIVVGDSGVGEAVGQWYHDHAHKAIKRELVIISGCDHQFQGTRNGKIMSKAPLWAFAGDTSFPSPEGGLELY